MYPRLWVTQLRRHVLKNFAWNTVLLLGLPVLYVLLPQVVAIGHSYLRGSGYVPSELEQRFFDDHWKIIGLTALLAFGAAEVPTAAREGGAVYQRFIPGPDCELAKRARLPYNAGRHFHSARSSERRGDPEPILRRQSAGDG